MRILFYFIWWFLAWKTQIEESGFNVLLILVDEYVLQTLFSWAFCSSSCFLYIFFIRPMEKGLGRWDEYFIRKIGNFLDFFLGLVSWISWIWYFPEPLLISVIYSWCYLDINPLCQRPLPNVVSNKTIKQVFNVLLSQSWQWGWFWSAHAATFELLICLWLGMEYSLTVLHPARALV